MTITVQGKHNRIRHHIMRDWTLQLIAQGLQVRVSIAHDISLYHESDNSCKRCFPDLCSHDPGQTICLWPKCEASGFWLQLPCGRAASEDCKGCLPHRPNLLQSLLAVTTALTWATGRGLARKLVAISLSLSLASSPLPHRAIAEEAALRIHKYHPVHGISVAPSRMQKQNGSTVQRVPLFRDKTGSLSILGMPMGEALLPVQSNLQVHVVRNRKFSIRVGLGLAIVRLSR